MRTAETAAIIDEKAILGLMNAPAASPGQIDDILMKSHELKGLSLAEVAALMTISQPYQVDALFETARQIKSTIYGERLVIFAPLYVSNLCANECLYCAFRARNKTIQRRALTSEEIAIEIKALVDQGHKRVLLVAGEAYPKRGFQFVLDAIQTIYETQTAKGNIRRVNVNVAPLDVPEFRELKAAKIGTYQLFQETYHRETYMRMHIGGPKKDYDYRITAPDRAMEAGVDDLGIGVLFGLYDWKFEMLALMQHIQHLESTFGVGPHTLSVPRLEPANGSDIAVTPPYPVNDNDFRKIVAILRLAVPYTGIIMSTRETATIRRETFALGVSQISAGSRTNPGGYSSEAEADFSQFSLGDHRPLDEVIRDVASLGYVPSFCTGCYRLGRTGQDFMDMAKPGLIRHYCQPNAMSTFQEYLIDYASPETQKVGQELLSTMLAAMEPKERERAEKLMVKVKAGCHDVYV